MKNAKYIYMAVAICFMASVVLNSCASRLDPVKHRNTPAATKKKIVKEKEGQLVEQELDMSTVEFTNLDDGEIVNVGDYMAENKLELILLLFGSQNCTACNEKNRELRDKYAGRVDFEFIGVNTDAKSSRPGILRYRQQNKFSFIRWSDPQGELMLREFLPEGTFGVPLSALISKDGIIWRYTNKDKVDVKKVIERANKTLKQIAKVAGRDLSIPHSIPEDSGSGEILSPAVVANSSSLYNGPLWKAGPERFSDLAVEDAEGAPANLTLAPKKIIQVSEGPCNEICERNIQTIAKECVAPNCSMVTLVVDKKAPLRPRIGARLFRGGREFLDVFRTNFNWRRGVRYDKEKFSVFLPDMEGPFIFTFNDKNELVCAREGDIAASSIDTKCLDKPKYPMYSPETGTVALNDLLSKSEYTVVNVFDKMCGSCRDELRLWSQPGNVYDTAKAKKWQIYSIEVTPPGDGVSLTQFYQTVKGGAHGTDSLGNRIPILLDASPMDAEFTGVSRYYQGYLVASYPEWEGYYGTVIYDREGKIVAAMKANLEGDHNEVLEKIRSL